MEKRQGPNSFRENRKFGRCKAMEMTGDVYWAYSHLGAFGPHRIVEADRELTRWVKYLPFKHEDLTSNVQHPC